VPESEWYQEFQARIDEVGCQHNFQTFSNDNVAWRKDMTSGNLGIDVAKDKLDVELQNNGSTWQATFANTVKGIGSLVKWMTGNGVTGAVHVCMEATGRYNEMVAEKLYELGHAVSIVNPVQIKRHSQKQLRRNKTDKVDAHVIVDFCMKENPRLWTPPPPEIKELQALYGRYDDLVTMKVQETNRQKAGVHSASLTASLKASIAFFVKQIKQVVQQIAVHIKQYPELQKRCKLLESIKGIAIHTAGRLVAFQIETFENAPALAAYAGVTPRNNDSGKTSKPARMSRVGHAELRKALYMPALNSLRSNPVIKRLAVRLKKRGLKGRQIVVAAMHKLLHLAFGVLKTGVPFDPEWALHKANTP
jgi:transposase